MGDLLPCPFCGEAAEFWFDNEERGSESGEVYCTGCSASTRGSPQGWMRDEGDKQASINQAIKDWNRRATTAPNRNAPARSD